MSLEYIKQIDLIYLVESHLNRRGKSAGHKWTRFICPFCRSFPPSLYVTNGDEQTRGNWFVCKKCNRRGDALAWMQAYRSKSLAEALAALRIGDNPHVRLVSGAQAEPTATNEKL